MRSLVPWGKDCQELFNKGWGGRAGDGVRSSGRTQCFKDSSKCVRAAHLKEGMLAAGGTRMVGADGAVTSLLGQKEQPCHG